MDARPGRLESRWILGLLAVGYLLFVVYGSLVPLDYRPLPWSEAITRFREIRYLRLGMGSRADWVANLLLFIPLTFLWLGWLWPERSVAARVLVSALVWGAGIVLCFGIEFTQLFFPPRTVSQNDILAETVGGLIGVAFWWWFGPPLWTWVQRWREARGVTRVSEYLLWAYLAGLFLYSVLPLDLTISPVEIYHKWKAGTVYLIPFSYPVSGVVEFFYGVAADTVLWVPVSLLWIVSGRKTPAQAFRWTLGAVFLLELLQLFVWSRVTDVTDLVTGAAGAAVGAWLSRFFRREAGDGAAVSAFQQRNLLPWILLSVAAWTALLCAVFWYPFDFTRDPELVRERLPSLFRVPFSTYYYGTEFRAVTEVMHKILFFAPLGALLALGRLQIRRFSPWRPVYLVVALAVMLAVPTLIELGQVALPAKYPDATDWVLQLVGAGFGYLLVIVVRNRMLLAAKPPGRRRGAEVESIQR